MLLAELMLAEVRLAKPALVLALHRRSSSSTPRFCSTSTSSIVARRRSSFFDAARLLPCLRLLVSLARSLHLPRREPHCLRPLYSRLYA